MNEIITRVNILTIIHAAQPSALNKEIAVTVQGGTLTFQTECVPVDLLTQPGKYQIIETQTGEGALRGATYSFVEVKPEG